MALNPPLNNHKFNELLNKKAHGYSVSISAFNTPADNHLLLPDCDEKMDFNKESCKKDFYYLCTKN